MKHYNILFNFLHPSSFITPSSPYCSINYDPMTCVTSTQSIHPCFILNGNILLLIVALVLILFFSVLPLIHLNILISVTFILGMYLDCTNLLNHKHSYLIVFVHNFWFNFTNILQSYKPLDVGEQSRNKPNSLCHRQSKFGLSTGATQSVDRAFPRIEAIQSVDRIL